MKRSLALGAASAMLLQVIENLFPATQSILPLGQNGFIQTSGVMLGSVAVWVFWDHFFGGGGSDDDQSPPIL